MSGMMGLEAYNGVFLTCFAIMMFAVIGTLVIGYKKIKDKE